MTKEGYHTILIRQEDYETISSIAKKKNQSRVKTISEIIKEFIERHQNE